MKLEDLKVIVTGGAQGMGRTFALALASLAGAVASASWLVLMRTHAALHPQYNSMAFYQGFIWFAIPFIVVFAVGAWKEFHFAGESS